ncbi:MAG: Asp-tRNA(Asn)/Glu-tRNA(Gln) amidotransferase subunit GatC [Parachlamydiales bacterium]|nr:Asp-tRNA(Asn)/Glu-tRNA(Gln) amidotransferase subunit GatC [Parachlamydiales bacterium]
MAELNKQTVKHLTRLCRIRCSDEEEESLLHDLKEIVDYVELLQEVDTNNVEPFLFVVEQDDETDAMRDDTVGDPLSREDYLSNAPSHVGGMVRVPPVLKPAQ